MLDIPCQVMLIYLLGQNFLNKFGDVAEVSFGSIVLQGISIVGLYLVNWKGTVSIFPRI